ncbi:MAG: FHA domain-containing protein [Proteobacteria bacterium]|nr:FHA domain-containing protein [Pseudomonadota bacterium]
MENKVIESTFISRKPLLPVLEIISSEAGHKIQKNILSDCVIVGRSDQADISIDDDKLSRNHFMLVRSGDRFEIKDLNSSNGIVVNGKRVKNITLTGNDTIIAGSTLFNFVLTRSDLEKQVLSTPSILESSFEKKYTKKSGIFTSKNIITALIVSIVVFAATWAMFGGEQEAKVSPIIKRNVAELNQMASVEEEIAKANLSQEDKIKAINYFKLSEYHFKSKNYSLAKNSMLTYFSMVPDSIIAPAFIAACEEALGKATAVDDKIDEIQKDTDKRELVSKLVEDGYRELRDKNYDQAMSIFMKVITLDEYNDSAYEGLITAEKELNAQMVKVPEPTVKQIPMGDIYAKQMEKAFKKENYSRAYELSQRIVNMGQTKAGRNSFLKAVAMGNKIMEITNRIFVPMNREAGLLRKSDATSEALKVYNRILAIFPYNQSAIDGVVSIKKERHEQAKTLYEKAVVSATYPDINDAKSKLKMIFNIVPMDDVYYNKAKAMLKRLG